ncbi:hypothetical protein BKA63DRAFT_522751, partial [Paraphoma chrysanthemicola]
MTCLLFIILLLVKHFVLHKLTRTETSRTDSAGLPNIMLFIELRSRLFRTKEEEAEISEEAYMPCLRCGVRI